MTFLCPLLLLLAFLPHNVSIPPFSATLTPLDVFVFSLYLYCSLGSQKQHSEPSTHIWLSLRTETRIQHQVTSQSSHSPQDTIQDRSFHMLVTRCACQRKFINMTGFWHFWHYRLEMWIFSDDPRKKLIILVPAVYEDFSGQLFAFASFLPGEHLWLRERGPIHFARWASRPPAFLLIKLLDHPKYKFYSNQVEESESGFCWSMFPGRRSFRSNASKWSQARSPFPGRGHFSPPV